MTALKRIDYILLGLINLHPRVSGYELGQIINVSTSFFSPIHLSQIYPSLKKLNQQDLAEYEKVAQENKPDRKLYSLTQDGLDALNAWLTEPFAFELSRACMDMYTTRLILMGHLPAQTIIAYLDSGIEYLTKTREEVANEDLSNELTYLTCDGADARDRYTLIWERELEAINEGFFNLRIRELTDIRDGLQEC